MFDLKLSTAIYVFRGLLTKAELANADRTRLMKLLYLTNIRYLADVPDCTPEDTPFAEYQYTAFPNGPLEEYVYSYIETIRRFILDGGDDSELSGELEHYRERLDAAIEDVKKYFVPKETSWLVDFTHNDLFEWARTNKKERLTFSDGYGMECSALSDYLKFAKPYDGD